MNTIKRSISNNLLYAFSAMVMLCFLSGCIQSNAAIKEEQTTSSVALAKPITENTLKVVNAAFYQKFVLGDWRYQGAKNLGGSINAYIRIPAPLDMSQDLQKSYLKQAICPSSANTRMWKEISGIPLSIHIYTHKAKNSLYVNCINPLITG